MQLHTAFSIKEDSYKVHIHGMHPGIREGQMELNGVPVREDSRNIVQCYLIRWHHAPSIYFDRDEDGDDQSVSFKDIFRFTGRGITLSAHFLVSKAFDPLRIGVGASIRCSFLKEMVGQWVHGGVSHDGENSENTLHRYIPKRPYYFTWAPLMQIGFKVIEKQNYNLFIDATWAPCFYNFSGLGNHYYWIYGRNFDLGATWEKQLTRYINWNLRVGYGFCLNNELVEDEDPSAPPDISSHDNFLHISHYIGGIIAQVGISMRIPVLSKCPIKKCDTSPDHRHGGKHYRGGSLFDRL